MKGVIFFVIIFLSSSVLGNDFSAHNVVFDIKPIELIPNLNNKKVLLGEKLFHDPILSSNKGMSCSSCHFLDQGGDDNKSLSTTLLGQRRIANTSTVFNSVNNIAFTWSGKQKDLSKLTLSLIKSPKALGSKVNVVLTLLQENKEYQQLFKGIFSDGITINNVVDALVYYQKQLITPNSRFDQYLKGNLAALNQAEKKGYDLFKSYGCINCHQGINIGGNMYQKFGVFGNYFFDRDGKESSEQIGRESYTKAARDKSYYRVPSLRNIAVTGPYLHDGSVESLFEVVKLMAKFQLGTEMPQSDVENIVKFLHTLTGEYRGVSLNDQN